LYVIQVKNKEAISHYFFMLKEDFTVDLLYLLICVNLRFVF
jgi:hypothetical protein